MARTAFSLASTVSFLLLLVPQWPETSGELWPHSSSSSSSLQAVGRRWWSQEELEALEPEDPRIVQVNKDAGFYDPGKHFRLK